MTAATEALGGKGARAAHENTGKAEQGDLTGALQVFVGVVLLTQGLVALSFLVWAYGPAERLVTRADTQDAPSGTIHSEVIQWWGPDFTVSVTTSVLLVAAAAGFVGSVIQQARIFAIRTGHQTAERSFLWWYLLRPLPSMLLGAVVVTAVNAGLVSIGDKATSPQGLSVLITAAAVAGLFTDAVLQRMRNVLGANDPTVKASGQPGPQDQAAYRHAANVPHA